MSFMWNKRFITSCDIVALVVVIIVGFNAITTATATDGDADAAAANSTATGLVMQLSVFFSVFRLLFLHSQLYQEKVSA